MNKDLKTGIRKAIATLEKEGHAASATAVWDLMDAYQEAVAFSAAHDGGLGKKSVCRCGGDHPTGTRGMGPGPFGLHSILGNSDSNALGIRRLISGADEDPEEAEKPPSVRRSAGTRPVRDNPQA